MSSILLRQMENRNMENGKDAGSAQGAACVKVYGKEQQLRV